jgi:hypothetical protein
MDIAFDSVAFAAFLAAHLLAAIALTAPQPGSDRGGAAPCAVAHARGARSSPRLSRASRSIMSEMRST